MMIAEDTEVLTREVERLVLVLDGEMKRTAIQEILGLRHEVYFRDAYLVPALEAGYIEMTIPDKPTSGRQRYRLTDRGLALAISLRKGAAR